MNSYDTKLYAEMIALKQQNPNLQIWISIGGWGAGGQVFSNIASSSSTRATFANSVLSWLQTYGFDGADIDWEYPAAPDRDGVPADTQNYNLLLSEVRSALGYRYGLSITIPSSYCKRILDDFKNIQLTAVKGTCKASTSSASRATLISSIS